MPSSLRPTPRTWSEARERLADDRTRRLAAQRKQALRRPAFPRRLRRQATRRRLVVAWALTVVAFVASSWIAPESLVSLAISTVTILALLVAWIAPWRAVTVNSPVEVLDERELRLRVTVEAWSWRILVGVVFAIAVAIWIWAVARGEAPPHDGVRNAAVAFLMWAARLPAAVETWITPDVDEQDADTA